MVDAVWVFGYGSLIWRPAFAYTKRRPCYVRGWARRFWQDSADHRGTPLSPGRVVTLVRDASSRCDGMAYRVAPQAVEAVLGALDRRERGGYDRHLCKLNFLDAHAPVSGLVYVAAACNPHFAGESSVDAIADQVMRSTGPSGPNTEYVLELADALRALGASDPHVFEVAAAVRARL